MPTLKEIQADIDARAAALLPALESHQAEYLAKYGRHWQGLPTCETPPADGKRKTPDKLTAKPHYEIESWSDTKIDVGDQPFAIAITQYTGPLGPGWIAIVEAMIGDVVYQRCADHGPEDRTRDWSPIAEIAEVGLK